jgi:hypothetical protein
VLGVHAGAPHVAVIVARRNFFVVPSTDVLGSFLEA